ncbi:response regulator transcription factor [Photobacterium swingsii]|uniref:response regulator transcription factor n=1 Tax=Photobacterium swingsii TaxID=680026 RepID=UPI003D12638E
MASRIRQHSMTVLIVEPNEGLSQQISEQFWLENFVVRRCSAGNEVQGVVAEGGIDLIILSMQLPEMSGLTLLKRCRQFTGIPIILIAAHYQMADCMNGFMHGADDYITQQRPLKELVYRAMAILRRLNTDTVSPEKRHELVVGELKMDRQRLSVTVNEQSISMTPIQFKLLWTLVSQPAEILSKSYLYRQVLAREFSPYDRSLDMHLSRVRKKLVAAGMSAERLQTSHGKGYRFA